MSETTVYAAPIHDARELASWTSRGVHDAKIGDIVLNARGASSLVVMGGPQFHRLYQRAVDQNGDDGPDLYELRAAPLAEADVADALAPLPAPAAPAAAAPGPARPRFVPKGL